MLKKFIAATLLLLCAMGAGVASEPTADRYENLALGLRLTKPAGWRFMTAEENTENLKRIEFSSEEFKKKVVAYTQPLVMVTQYPQDHVGVNPAVKLSIKSFVGLPDPTAEGVLKLGAEGMTQQFPDVQISTVTQVRVAGRSARRMTVDFSTRATDGGGHAVSSVIWIVPDGDFYLMVGASYPQGEHAVLE